MHFLNATHQDLKFCAWEIRMFTSNGRITTKMNKTKQNAFSFCKQNENRTKHSSRFCKSYVNLKSIFQFEIVSKMGRLFLEHMGGDRVVVCIKCDTPLTNRDSFESGNYLGSTGKAVLYAAAVNLRYSDVQERTMLTGKHFVRDVYCKTCDVKMGWTYEFAVEEGQRHKEGKVILEKAFIKECD